MLLKLHLIVVAIVSAMALAVSSISVKGTQIAAGPERQLSHGTLNILIEKDGREDHVKTPTEMTSVETTAVFGDMAVVLGSSPNVDEAVMVCGANMKTERAIGYSMQLLGNWLVGIEFYPNHLAPNESSTDVVLVRNLEDDSCKSATRGTVTESTLIKGAGRPVYPARNRAGRSYQNVFEGNVETVAVYPRTFVRMPGNRLAFVAARFREGSRGSPEIVTVPVSPQTGPPSEYSLEGAAASLGLSSARGLEIVGAEFVGKGDIRIRLQKGAYKEDSIVIPIG